MAIQLSYKSKLVLMPEFSIMFVTKKPNWWWRFWQWFLLGWRWEDVIDGNAKDNNN
ncbi:MAG: hypothetical protein PHV98_00825 [Candidatus Omnitrophica bacterium]|nr:hypothetical protein [Candidatus Omnitrophota bacterium]